MSSILLSIKPEYADKILLGEKKFEYRKHISVKKIDKIVIYSTYPVQKIVGEVDVIGVLSMKKTPLWENTKQYSGITRKKYREYFSNSKQAYAYILSNPKRYLKDKSLEELDVKYAPQGFIYLD